MPCNAACIKIIINTGFMATLAPILAKNTGFIEIRTAAEVLAVAADTHQRMLAAAGLTAVAEEGWGGCKQAQYLVRWIYDLHEDPVKDNKIALMGKWTDDLWIAVADLAAGKLPA